MEFFGSIEWEAIEILTSALVTQLCGSSRFLRRFLGANSVWGESCGGGILNGDGSHVVCSVCCDLSSASCEQQLIGDGIGSVPDPSCKARSSNLIDSVIAISRTFCEKRWKKSDPN